MDDINIQKESKTRDVSMRNTDNVTGGEQINIVREQKVVPSIGLDLLANQHKKVGSRSSSPSGSREGDEKDDESGLESLNINRSHVPFTGGPSRPPRMNIPQNVHGADDLSVSTGSEDEMSAEESESDSGSETTSIYSAEAPGSSGPPRVRTFEDIQAEKQELLSKIERMVERYGMKPTKRYSIMSNVDDLRFELHRMKRQRGVEKAIRFGRKTLTATVAGIEWLNNRFDTGAKLDGWSEDFADELEDYDETFEELYDKYKDTVQMPPELSLIVGVGGSAVQYHIKKSLFSSNMPGLNEVLRNNPDIMRNISQAAANSMRQNQQQYSTPPPQSRPMPTSARPPRPAQRAPPSRTPKAPPVSMSRPSGVDDILQEIHGGGGDNRFETLSSASESTAQTGTASTRKKRSLRNVMNI